MVEKLLKKQKSALLLTVGSAVGLIAGGAVAWWITQNQPIATGLPVGADIIPQDASVTLTFTTDKGQWQQLRRFGTPTTQKALDRNLAKLRDRILFDNGLNYQQDIQPWVGNEITIAFLPPPGAKSDAKPTPESVQPYSSSASEQATLMVLPIANPDRAEQLLTNPKVTAAQKWVDRDYKGAKIREVHGQTQRDYAATVLDNRYLVVSHDTQAVERVIDAFKGRTAIAKAPGYSQAFGQLKAVNPFMEMYVNVPAASNLTTNDPRQPIPPQSLIPFQKNQGLAAVMTLESDGIRLQGTAWLPSDSPRHKVINNDQQMTALLPADTVLMTSGSNLKQAWQDYSQQPDGTAPQRGTVNPTMVRNGFANLTGLDLDKDLMSWMDGEFSLALVSAPATAAVPQPRAGVLLLTQTSDRRAADDAFKRLDQLMKERYRFQVNEAEVAGNPVVNWVSPFQSLTITRGWLDGNIAFIAVGPGVATTILPAPGQPLAENPLFQKSASSDSKPHNGHFFIELDRLAGAKTGLPFPALPPDNQEFLKAIRAIGMTTTIQDGRTTNYDINVLMQKTNNSPGALPSPSPKTDQSPGTDTNAPASP
jgi:hypothetical protein